MNLDGQDIGRLRDVIINNCYLEEEFKEILYRELNFTYENFAQGDNYSQRVFNIILHFSSQGETPFWNFLNVICQKRCDREDLQKTCKSIREIYQSKYVLPDLTEHFKELADSLVQGKLIFFLGSGINLSDDNLMKDPQFSPSDKRIAYALSDFDTRKPRDLLGFPCEICPYKSENRPGGQGLQEPLCPVIRDIGEKKPEKQQLMKEQDLAFAKLEIKCNAQFMFARKDSIDTRLRDIYSANYAPNKVQEALVNIVCSISNQYNNYPLIITTNYDCGLEKAFEKKGQDIDIVYYAVDTKDPRDIIPNVKFISYKIQNQNNGENKSYQDKIDAAEIVELNSDNEHDTIKFTSELELCPDVCPMIVKLYGGDIYKFSTDIDEGKTDKFECSFALAGINSPRDLSDNKNIALPLKIKNACRSNMILFLGYSATDSELRYVLDYLIPPPDCRLKDSKGWLIHQSDIGKLNIKLKKYWERQRVELNIEYPWEEYIQQFQKYIEKNI